MEKLTQIWNDDKFRCGGFYELDVEISDNSSSPPIKELLQSLFELDFVKGPFNWEFEKIDLDLEYFENLGLIEVDDKLIPFKIYYISEEGQDGNIWLDISIYTAILEEVLGQEYRTWSENPKYHPCLDEQLLKILKKWNSVYKIKLGTLGFEVSGMYDLEWLTENQLRENDVLFTRFFVNKTDLLHIDVINHDKVHII